MDGIIGLGYLVVFSTVRFLLNLCDSRWIGGFFGEGTAAGGNNVKISISPTVSTASTCATSNPSGVWMETYPSKITSI